MIACYDLACNPPTYDVVAFLAHAELERQRVGAESIELHILPGPAGGFRRDGLWPHSVEERVLLRDKLLVPLCGLLPSVHRVHVDPDHQLESNFGGRRRLISLSEILRALRAGCRPLRALKSDAPEPGHRYVTFTLRQADHHQVRNSRVDEWLRAAAVLEVRGLAVYIIPDTAEVRRGAGRVVEPGRWTHRYLPAASRFIPERAAVYARARLNVGICNGPMWMAIFMGAPVLMLRPTTDAAGGCYDDRFYAKCGLPRGGQLPTSPPHQRLVWEEDTCDNIVRGVEEMLEVVA